jgi:NAD(P)-dependent dehydrogenase (short-subunit alcohol dehydrogenase family)
MIIQPGQTVLLTGATGGLGLYMARAFAKLGTKLALVAYPGAGLEAVRQEVEHLGSPALTLAHDLRGPAATARRGRGRQK